MATLPTDASLTGATTTNAQQKTNFSAIRQFLADLLGTDSSNKAAARAALAVPGTADFTSLKAANGWKKDPSGIIEQWCVSASIAVAANTQTQINVTWPSPFPNACLASSPVSFGAFSNMNNVTIANNVWSTTGASALVISPVAQNIIVFFRATGH